MFIYGTQGGYTETGLLISMTTFVAGPREPAPTPPHGKNVKMRNTTAFKKKNNVSVPGWGKARGKE